MEAIMEKKRQQPAKRSTAQKQPARKQNAASTKNPAQKKG